MYYYIPYKYNFIKVRRERDETNDIFLKRIFYIKEQLKINENIEDIIIESLCLKNVWLYNVTY